MKKYGKPIVIDDGNTASTQGVAIPINNAIYMNNAVYGFNAVEAANAVHQANVISSTNWVINSKS